jgi:hypothetical protein
VVAAVDDAYIKVAKVHGSLAWHSHEHEDECHLMLIERKSTRHTGDTVTDKTRSLADQLRPV